VHVLTALHNPAPMRLEGIAAVGDSLFGILLDLRMRMLQTLSQQRTCAKSSLSLEAHQGVVVVVELCATQRRTVRDVQLGHHLSSVGTAAALQG